MAAATAEAIKKKYPELEVLVEPGAALVNMEKIRNDKTDLAWSMTTVLADARMGANSWKGKQTDKPLFVANYYPNVWQLVVTADSGVKTLKDLKGKSVGAAAPRQHQPGRGVGVAALKIDGMKLDDLGTKSFGSHHRERRGHPEPPGHRPWAGSRRCRPRSCSTSGRP